MTPGDHVPGRYAITYVAMFKCLTLVVLSLAIVMQAEDGANCSNATRHGSYGLHAKGMIIGVGDFAAVGRFTFDGNGNLTGRLFVRVAGNNIAPPAFTGTYSVSPDCTVTDNWGAPITARTCR